MIYQCNIWVMFLLHIVVKKCTSVILNAKYMKIVVQIEKTHQLNQDYYVFVCF